MPLPKKRAEPPKFSAHVYCGQTAGWIKMVLGMEVGLGPVHIVLDGDTAPLPKKGGRASLPPNFRSTFIVAKRLDASRCHLVWSRPQPRRLCDRWGPSALPQKGRSPTQFLAHVYCGQTAAWIKMPLGTEVGRPRPTRYCIRCGPSYPQKKGHIHPTQLFGPCLLWPNGWMDEDAA